MIWASCPTLEFVTMLVKASGLSKRRKCLVLASLEAL